MSAQPVRAEVELRMAEGLVDCAGALALRFGEAAQAEPDLDRALTLGDAFQRSFQAVRLGIRLCLTLRSGRAPAAFAPREAREEPEAEGLERERLERPERETVEDPPERDRERDRDYEPVSLSRFLSTLRGVAADAARLPAVAGPTVLPKLQDLLAQADAPPPATNVLLRPRPPAPPQKVRLLGSAVPPPTLGMAVRPRPPPQR